jgi:lactate dehydrogenase-like 2-hydroxyacid dehydrogenase
MASTASCAPAGDPLNADTIAKLPASVRMIATFSVGYEHVDVAAAPGAASGQQHADVLTDATADIAMLCLPGRRAAGARGHHHAAHPQLGRLGADQLMGVHVTGKRLGILGMGRIGQALADRAAPSA